MTTEQAWVVDKTGWPEGPWMDEPDRLQWITEAGLDGLIVRGHHGALCGYVGLPAGHPDYGKPYDEVDVEAHCGLTYGRTCDEQGPICHTPEAGRPDDVFWLGFECAHAGDYSPACDRISPWRTLSEILQPTWSLPGDPYQNLNYVRQEVENLARQLAARA